MGSLSPLGELPPVPRYEALEGMIPEGPGREGFRAISAALEDLGRAVQLGNHRRLVEELSLKLEQLGSRSLMDMSVAALQCEELCTALSVYLTCLEQTYHWPREDDDLTTPSTLNEHKMVIQVFHELELRAMLDEFLLTDERFACETQQRPFGQEQMVLAALAMAKGLFDEATAAKAVGAWPLADRVKQDRVNLLNRTARGDIWDQGPYASRGCHKEMGRLHEMVRTNGTQRRCQEIFEDAGGITRLQRMPALLTRLDDSPASSLAMCEALADLQLAIACANEELFSMLIDEVIWGHTFAKWSKACGVCDIGSSGSDCPLFWMLDGFSGRADPKGQAILPDSLASRSRFFPPSVTALVTGLASAPSLRAHIAKGGARYPLVQAWNGFQHGLRNMYDIHRKKAMRIILALRAGRGKTSSGVQKAASPETHLSNTLHQAISIRFGPNERDLDIDGYAWSTPLLFSPSGNVETARARFVFSTPLVVSPGDTLSVSVPLEGADGQVEWHSRIYSITLIDVLHWATKAAGGSCQLASSVEVCVRNNGAVSSHICNQQASFPVRLAIKSTPHFRIQANTSPRDETIFIAQGGAVGVYLAWLARQETLVGRYRLVVGTRDYSMLAYSEILERLAAKFGSALRVVVALSRPALGDVRTLLANRLKPFTGRVTGYLSLCSLFNQGKTTWYVCGSAEFGLDVAKCLEARPKMAGDAQTIFRGLGTRLRPILTSELPPLRLHVAGSSTMAGTKGTEAPRMIPRTELALHNQPEDRWLALGSRVFDISILPTFHPGGEKVLAHCSGREAQSMFDTVHKDTYMIETMLQQMFIGELAPPNQSEWEEIADSLVEIQNDLEAQSRFEQTPTGCPEQLERSPSAEIIRGSIDGLVRGWTERVLSVQEGTLDLSTRLQAALGEVNIYLNGIQARAYTDHFADVARCAAVLKHVFECHYTAISKIHDIIDEMKREIYESVEILGVTPEKSLLRKGTEEIIKAVHDMTIEDIA